MPDFQWYSLWESELFLPLHAFQSAGAWTSGTNAELSEYAFWFCNIPTAACRSCASVQRGLLPSFQKNDGQNHHCLSGRIPGEKELLPGTKRAVFHDSDCCPDRLQQCKPFCHRIPQVFRLQSRWIQFSEKPGLVLTQFNLCWHFLFNARLLYTCLLKKDDSNIVISDTDIDIFQLQYNLNILRAFFV